MRDTDGLFPLLPCGHTAEIDRKACYKVRVDSGNIEGLRVWGFEGLRRVVRGNDRIHEFRSRYTDSYWNRDGIGRQERKRGKSGGRGSTKNCAKGVRWLVNWAKITAKQGLSPAVVEWISNDATLLYWICHISQVSTLITSVSLYPR